MTECKYCGNENGQHYAGCHVPDQEKDQRIKELEAELTLKDKTIQVLAELVRQFEYVLSDYTRIDARSITEIIEQATAKAKESE